MDWIHVIWLAYEKIIRCMDFFLIWYQNVAPYQETMKALSVRLLRTIRNSQPLHWN